MGAEDRDRARRYLEQARQQAAARGDTSTQSAPAQARKQKKRDYLAAKLERAAQQPPPSAP